MRGSSEVAAEERGGRGGANTLRKGAGSALPPHACARPAPPARRPGLLPARPTPTVRTLEPEEPHGPPATPGPEKAAARPSGWRADTCSFSRGLRS